MLNKKQQEVVDFEGALVNIAGPGSGKTHTLISKISYIVSKNDNVLKNLLVLTFTNSAANEILTRSLEKLDIGNLNNLKHSLYFGTYHSIFKRLLSENNIFNKLNLGNNPSIVMPKESVRYFTNLMKNDLLENYIDLVETATKNYYKNDKIKKPKIISFNKTILRNQLIDGISLLSFIDSQINFLKSSDIISHTTISDSYNFLTDNILDSLESELEKTLRYSKKVIDENKNDEIDIYTLVSSSNIFGKSIYLSLILGRITIPEILKMVKKYLHTFFSNKFLQQSISFGDIMLLTLYSLTHFDNFRLSLNNKFQYLFLDEFQDTNIIQSEIMYLIYNPDITKTICIIGDPYQSIYKFLGANYDNLPNAIKDLNAHTIQLVENYRSNQNIVDLTNHLGFNMIDKIDNWSKCVSSNTTVANNPIYLYDSIDEVSQARKIVEIIKEFSPKTTIGILNRTGDVYLLEAELNKSRLKYDKLGGVALGESLEIKFLIHLYLYFLNGKKLESLLFILNGMSGIGEKSISEFEVSAMKELKDIEFDLSINNFNFLFTSKNKIKKVLNEIYNIKQEYDISNSSIYLSSFIEKIQKYYFDNLFPNISKKWKDDRIDEALSKLNILFDEIKEKDFPEEILALLDDYVSGVKNKSKERTNNITVSTIHSSKGLEWDVVLLMNFDNKSFEKDDKGEAQRLAYVAISRARESLYIFSTEQKFFSIKNDFIINNPDLFKTSDDNLDDIYINFGKYNGYLIDDIPYSYLSWMFENKNDLIKKGLINKSIIKKLDTLFSIDF